MKHSRSLKTAHPHISCWYIATPQNSKKAVTQSIILWHTIYGSEDMVDKYKELNEVLFLEKYATIENQES